MAPDDRGSARPDSRVALVLATSAAARAIVAALVTGSLGGPRRDVEGRAPQAQGVRPRRGGEGPRHDVRRSSVRRRQADAGSPGLVSAVEPVCGAVVDVHFASSTLASEQRLADRCRPRRKLASAIRLRRMPRQGASISSEGRRIEAVRPMSRSRLVANSGAVPPSSAASRARRSRRWSAPTDAIWSSS